MTHDKVIDKIRKMLALAHNAGATDGERANALSQAHKWLAKYNLDMATVTAQANAANGLDASGEPRVKIEGRFFGEIWARAVAHSVADLFFCSYYYRSRGANTSDVDHTFIGRESNAITAMEVARFVVQSIYKEAMAYRKRITGHYRDYRAFAQGAMARVIARALQLKKEPVKPEVALLEDQSEPGTALVLANYYESEATANADFIKKQVGTITVSKSQMRLANNQDAKLAGYRYGDKVSLTPQITTKV